MRISPTFPGSTPWVAVDRGGDTITVWNETGSLIFARRYSAADRTWDRPVPISGGLLGVILDIVMDLERNATVLYPGDRGPLRNQLLSVVTNVERAASRLH